MSGYGGRISRRRLLKSTIAASGAFVGGACFLRSPARGAVLPGNRINVGCIGAGRMGLGDLRDILRFDEVQVVAVCDVDSDRAGRARRLVEEEHGSAVRSGSYRGCAVYGDFRELLARDDIDAVTISTPDHWHTMPALAAAEAGKDIFVQKPLSMTIEEGRALSDTVRRLERVFMVGSQQRSDYRFRFACELVRSGRIGKLHTVRVGLPIDPGCGIEPVMPVPKELDYEMWLGPAPWAEYTERRVHPQEGYGRPGWLRIKDYCHGMITGWGAHHLDIAQWGMGTEYSGPVEIRGRAEFPEDGLWNVHGRFHIEYTYPDGVKVICADNEENKQGVVFEGSEGRVYVRRGYIEARPMSLLSSKIGPGDVQLYRSNDHKGNFIECIKSRRETIAPVEVAHRSCSVGILGSIAMDVGRPLRWDPEKECFTGDAEANRRLSRPMRSPWRL